MRSALSTAVTAALLLTLTASAPAGAETSERLTVQCAVSTSGLAGPIVFVVQGINYFVANEVCKAMVDSSAGTHWVAADVNTNWAASGLQRVATVEPNATNVIAGMIAIDVWAAPSDSGLVKLALAGLAQQGYVVSYASSEVLYQTVNGPKTLAQMDSELRAIGWSGGADVAATYASTTGAPVTPFVDGAAPATPTQPTSPRPTPTPVVRPSFSFDGKSDQNTGSVHLTGNYEVRWKAWQQPADKYRLGGWASLSLYRDDNRFTEDLGDGDIAAGGQFDNSTIAHNLNGDYYVHISVAGDNVYWHVEMSPS